MKQIILEDVKIGQRFFKFEDWHTKVRYLSIMFPVSECIDGKQAPEYCCVVDSHHNVYWYDKNQLVEIVEGE